jgi:hypothetical protein
LPSSRIGISSIDIKVFSIHGLELSIPLAPFILAPSLKHAEKIAANYPWPAYSYAGFKLIDDAYRTMIDFDPYGDYMAEFSTIRKNSEILINGPIHQKVIAFRV